MTTFKDALYLLVIFIAYGITGHLDYEDTVQLEQTLQERQHAACLVVSAPAVRDALTAGQLLTVPVCRHD